MPPTSFGKSADMFLPDVSPYALPPDAHEEYLHTQLQELLTHHRASCPPYARLVDDWSAHHPNGAARPEDYPFLPVTLFKEYDLSSTRDAVLSLKSSATTSDKPSRIFVDRSTRNRQSLSA